MAAPLRPVEVDESRSQRWAGGVASTVLSLCRLPCRNVEQAATGHVSTRERARSAGRAVRRTGGHRRIRTRCRSPVSGEVRP
ncbi:hypothetical protein GS506_15870 [Rhodococcus hoagii]|nr:hypothetical protein [Prescottella equi]